MATSSKPRYNVFLCHNSQDKNAVKAIGEELKARGIEPWLDEWDLRPGASFVAELEALVESIPAAAVFVGASGVGPWQAKEIQGLLLEMVERGCHLVPAVLQGCPRKPQLPLFLRDLNWVDFRKRRPDPLQQLLWGITGQKAKDLEPTYPDDKTRDLSQALEDAYLREEELLTQGEDPTSVRQEILQLRRDLREGGQLKAGDFLLAGRYRLLEPLGKGGFAKVFKAFDRKKRKLVALKVLHPQYAEDRTRRDRFFRGARKMGELGHPGIVQVLEPELEDGGYHFFTMEYVEGGDLRQAILTGKQSRDEGLQVVLKLAEALEFAHARDVVHRDVKPANILLAKNGAPKLTDFDLVRAVDTTGGTLTGSVLGTFLYMAPEAMEDAKEMDARGDVYSLAMTVAFVMHGRELPSKALRETDAFLRRLHCSATVQRALIRATALEPSERFPSVGELASTLQGGSPIVDQPEAWPPPWDGSVSTGEVEELFRWVDTPRDGRVALWRPIPAGRFLMGSPKEEEGRFGWEGFPREVVIESPFWMASVPVTNRQFLAFKPDHDLRAWPHVSEEELLDHPVVNVSWHDAFEFCRWVEKILPWARGVRLPTEVEWEYACRAGTRSRYWKGDGEEDLAQVSWYRGNSEMRTHRVGELEANPWGLYDVHGNVWEWCSTQDGAIRVFRGGAWFDDARLVRAAYRDGDPPVVRFGSLGFRLARGQGRGTQASESKPGLDGRPPRDEAQ